VEIVNPQLRRWIGLKPGQERHYDLQVALTHDPITLLHVYIIVQVGSPCSFFDSPCSFATRQWHDVPSPLMLPPRRWMRQRG
jgi:hypothetical protein